jgi:membrane-bound serine protease (ClpP class)
MRHSLLTYLLWQVPGWLAAGAVLAWLQLTFDLPSGLTVAVGAAYVVKDLLLYPAMRAVFRPAERVRPIGKRGEVLDPLNPVGLIRVDGELWQARAVAGPLAAGRQVVVRSAHGLTLLVEEATAGKPLP